MTDQARQLVTVMYHYVRDVANTPFPSINAVSIDEFRSQVSLVRETFETPSLEACVEFLEGRWDPGRDICILTFDDGLREHYESVAEILSSVGVTGAFFLPTAALEDHEVLAVHMNHFLLAALGTEGLRTALESAARTLEVALPPESPHEIVRAIYRWDDPETARLKYLLNHQLPAETTEQLLLFIFPSALGPTTDFARELYLDWDQASEMQMMGFAIGGHTHRHKVLSRMDDMSQQNDLSLSTNLLERRLGAGNRGFAYPYGKPTTYTADTIRHLKDLGYLCAFNTTVDRGRPGTSRWQIPRIDPKDL